MAIYEDPAFSSWVAALDSSSASDLDNYLATVYSDNTLAFTYSGTAYDESGAYPADFAVVVGSEGAWVTTTYVPSSGGLSISFDAMSATDYATWEASPAPVTYEDSAQVILGLNQPINLMDETS